MPGYIKSKSGNWRKIYDLQVQEGSAWHRVQNAYVKLDDNTWHPFFEYVPSVLTTVTLSTNTYAVTNAPNQSATLSGQLSTVYGAPVQYTPVSIIIGGSSVDVTTDDTGYFYYDWIPTKTGPYLIYAQFNGAGAYQSASSDQFWVGVSSPTSVVVNWPQYFVQGIPATITGTAHALTGDIPVGNTVALYIDGSRTTSSTTVDSSGNFSLSWTPRSQDAGSIGNGAVHVNYTHNYYVKKDDSSDKFFPASWSDTASLDNYYQTPPTPYAQVWQINNSNVNILVNDQLNTLGFTVYCPELNSGYTVASQGSTTATLPTYFSGLRQDTVYHFTVSAASDNPVNNTTMGNTITVTTGHNEVRDTGSGVFSFDASGTMAWRSTDGWGTALGLSRLAEGYPDSGPASPFYGVSSWNNSLMSSTINSYGGGNHPNRDNNVSVSKLEVYLDRVAGIGSSSGVSVDFYCAPNKVGTGTPTLGTSALGRVKGPDAGTHFWATLPTSVNSWFKNILQGNGLTMYADNSAQYSVYNGGSNFKLRATLSWDYAEVAYKAPTFSNG